MEQVDEFDNSLDSLSHAYQRHDLMAEINYKIRKLDLLAEYKWSVTDRNTAEQDIRNNVQFFFLLDSILQRQFFS